MACSKEYGGLGFRNFHMFNMVMVAKQRWNFIIKPNTLVACIFNARWMIGDGSDIKVMHDPWLRMEEGRWVGAAQNQEVFQENRLIWNEEQDGLYSFRSGYRKLMKEKRWTAETRATEPWGRLWKIQAPPKAKHLM
ncbi:putative ribonuclease H protein [Trifolium medium]|uniref:Putative ribonuclease H protein n=1 Tax=Trifolium medium TaxID=97028 RepID=A0A392MZ70_9FABA|nr:putative ribonuclease H protein [Trifolium medium]